MMAVMSTSLAVMYWGTGNPMATLYLFLLFAAIVTWAWRYPGSKAEAERRIAAGEKTRMAEIVWDNIGLVGLLCVFLAPAVFGGITFWLSQKVVESKDK